MDHPILWLSLFVIAVLLGPFATLRLLAHFRATNAEKEAIKRAAQQKKPYDDPE
jgi:hypothetical protein